MAPIKAPPAGRYRGRSPPGIPDEWTISTVSGHIPRSFSDDDEPDTVTGYVTGDRFSESGRHLRVTLKRATEGEYTPPEYRSLLIRDEAALDEWLVEETVPRMPPSQMDDELGW